VITWLKEPAARKAVITLNIEIYQDGTVSQPDVERFRAIRRVPNRRM